MTGTYAHFKRLAVRWLRDPMTVITSLVAPAAWLVFVGLAMPVAFTDNYAAFVTPGILVMTVLFSSLAGGSMLLYDKLQGFLVKFLALPASRESILLGNVGFITFRGLLQAAIIMVIALPLGAGPPGPAEAGLALGSLALFGVLFSALSTTLALYIDDVVEYASLSGTISMPLFFSSSALMPYSEMPSWLRAIASVNPVSFEIDTVRALMAGEIAYPEMLALAIMGAAALIFCTYVFRKTTA